MKTPDFAITILVDKTPDEVFRAIKNVRGWWSEDIAGNTAKLNDEFTLRYEDMHRCTIKLTEVIPGKKIVWLVLENYFEFTKDSSEWTGNKMIFEITQEGKKTRLRFTQVGLIPQYECYSICSSAWNTHIKLSLRNLIIMGKGEPNPAAPTHTQQYNSKKIYSNNNTNETILWKQR